MGYFSDRHGSKLEPLSSSGRSYYRERHQNEIPKSENVLQRAIKSINPNQVGYEVAQGKGPLDIGMGLGRMATGGKFSSGMNISSQAEGMRKEGAGDNWLLDIASDPTTYGGTGGALKGIGSGAKKLFPYISKEARVGFTKGVEKSLKSRRGALTRGFTHSLNKSKAKVDLSDILDEGSEITEFTMKEAQDLKNAISQGIPDAVKSSIKIDPKHFGDRRIAGLISDRMKKADSEMASVIDKYGKHAENFKSAISPIKGARGSENIFGSNLVSQMFRGGGIPEKAQVALKEFAPKVAKKVSGAKLNENIFRGVRGAAVGATLYKLVPNVLKRAFLSEVSK